MYYHAYLKNTYTQARDSACVTLVNNKGDSSFCINNKGDSSFCIHI